MSVLHHNDLEHFASRGLKAQETVDQILNGERSQSAATKRLPAVGPAGGSEPTPGRGAEAAAPRSSAREARAGAPGAAALHRLNSMPFINRTAVRNFLLEHARATRPHNRFRRVSEETLREIHESVRQMLIARVHRTPSKGRTM